MRPIKPAGRPPSWFAQLLAPPIAKRTFGLKGGVQLVITANASRAILDAWDNFQKLFVVGAVMLVLVNGLVFWLVKLALAPFPVITAGLRATGTRRSGLPLAAACRIRGSQHRIGVQSHGAGS